MTDSFEVIELEHELAPEPPPSGPWVWARENLFSSVASTILTILVGALVIGFIRLALGFVFAEERRWDAVFINARLLMVQAYPADPEGVNQMHRVWATVAALGSLGALSFAIWRVGGRISPNRVVKDLTAIGGVLVAVMLISLLGDPVFSIGVTIWVLLIGAAIIVGAQFVKRLLGERAKQETIPLMLMVAIGPGLAVLALWFIQLPLPIPVADGGGHTLEPIANSTRLGWLIVYLITVASYLIGLAIRDRIPQGIARGTLTVLWVLSFPVLVLGLLRDPDIDYDKLFEFPSGTLWVAVLFAVAGSALLVYLSNPKTGESGRLIAAGFVILAIAVWAFPMSTQIRLLLALFALFALAAPTFGGGEGTARARYIGGWVAAVVVTTVFITWVTSPSGIQVSTNFFIGGLFLSFILAIFSIALSFPIGVVLALGRTSSMPIFRLMSVAYIEIVRGVPLITWLLVSVVVFPIFLPPGVEFADVVKVLVFMTLFSAAYLAENVRGGLQSIPKGQHEAARAVGMTTTQLTVFIVLPQALRAVIPALVGQVIAIFKDTSLVVIVGLFDFLALAQKTVPLQTNPYNTFGSIREALLFAAVVYWIFTFSISRASQRLERKLGVGER